MAFLERVSSVVWNRRFFEGDDGRLGLAPPSAMTGDVIAILFGCNVPVVLREVNKGKYEVIGECYVHGLMDGEAISMDLIEKEFTLV